MCRGNYNCDQLWTLIYSLLKYSDGSVANMYCSCCVLLQFYYILLELIILYCIPFHSVCSLIIIAFSHLCYIFYKNINECFLAHYHSLSKTYLTLSTYSKSCCSSNCLVMCSSLGYYDGVASLVFPLLIFTNYPDDGSVRGLCLGSPVKTNN